MGQYLWARICGARILWAGQGAELAEEVRPALVKSTVLGASTVFVGLGKELGLAEGVRVPCGARMCGARIWWRQYLGATKCGVGIWGSVCRAVGNSIG